MEQRYIIYSRTDRSFAWPEQIEQSFEVVNLDMIPLDVGSQKQEDFLALCVKLEIVPFVSKYGVFGCTKKEVGKHPFYYLELKTILDYPDRQFEDRGTGCPGGERPCGNGMTQIEKILLPKRIARKLDRLDIASLPSSGPKNYILVTKRVRELFDAHGISGYRLVPCLETKVSYSSEDYLFGQKNSALESHANYFQLIITEKVIHYPDIGRLLDWSQCPVCGVVGMFRPHLLEGNTLFFDAGDLSATDLQICDGRRSTNLGTFRTKSAWLVASANVLRLLLDHNMSGVETAPSWPRAAVEIVDIH